MINYMNEASDSKMERERNSKIKKQDNNNYPEFLPFENKLAKQDKSVLNQTFTLGTNKEDRIRHFCIEDAINGFLPRARSSGPRSKMGRSDENVRRVRSETAALFSSTCKLPLLDGSVSSENKKCTIRPWSRTQDELRKFKETLQSTTVNNSSK